VSIKRTFYRTLFTIVSRFGNYYIWQDRFRVIQADCPKCRGRSKTSIFNHHCSNCLMDKLLEVDYK